ncbi:MAG TPA: hypothetical protein VGN34_17460 [Ktedonobacteraceae bacterium]
MEEPSSSFFALQFTLNEIALLDRLSKMKHLLSAYIAGTLRAWLGLRFFEGSPAVSSLRKTQYMYQVPMPAHFMTTIMAEKRHEFDLAHIW